MIGGIRRAALHRGPRVARGRRVRIELKWFVMRDVVDLGSKCAGLRGSGACASGRGIRIYDRKVESAFEPSPGETRSIEQVSNVLTGETGGVARVAGITGRLRVGGNCPGAYVPGATDLGRAARVTGNQVYCSHR